MNGIDYANNALQILFGSLKVETEGIWSYVKLPNGLAIAWAVTNPGSYTIYQAKGSLYCGGAISQKLPTGLFAAAPALLLDVSLSTEAYVISTQVSSKSATSFAYRITGTASIAANSGYQVSMLAIGRWK